MPLGKGQWPFLIVKQFLSEIYITVLCRTLIVFDSKFLEPLRYHSKLPKECFFFLLFPLLNKKQNDPSYFTAKTFMLLHKNYPAFAPETNISGDYFITVHIYNYPMFTKYYYLFFSWWFRHLFKIKSKRDEHINYFYIGINQ